MWFRRSLGLAPLTHTVTQLGSEIFLTKESPITRCWGVGLLVGLGLTFLSCVGGRNLGGGCGGRSWYPSYNIRGAGCIFGGLAGVFPRSTSLYDGRGGGRAGVGAWTDSRAVLGAAVGFCRGRYAGEDLHLTIRKFR